MSNFTFLKINWPELFETARKAEQNVNSAPRTSCFYARRSLERAVKWLYDNDSYLKQSYTGNLAVSLLSIFHLQISTTNKILTA
jgi:type I restriction enzyme R subunit